MRRLERSLGVAALAVLGLVLLAPLLGEGSILREAFAPLRHQIPARRPALFGVTLPVCWRCLGLVADLGVERLVSGLCLGIAVPLALRAACIPLSRSLRRAWRARPPRTPADARGFSVR